MCIQIDDRWGGGGGGGREAQANMEETDRERVPCNSAEHVNLSCLCLNCWHFNIY